MNSTKRMIPVFSVLLVVGLLAGPLALDVQAAEGPAINQTVVKGSVDDVLKMITKMVADNGMMVMGEIHQGKILEMTGLKVKSESIFVGNPSLGKKLFSAEPGVGQVVPIRINIFENAEGQTVVSYITPSSLLAGFDNPELDKMAAMLDQKLDGMVGMIGS